jgi:hypothetical protein
MDTSKRHHVLRAHRPAITAATAEHSVIGAIAVVVPAIITEIHIGSGVVAAIAIQAPSFMSAVGIGLPWIIIEGIIPPRPSIEITTIEISMAVTTVLVSASMIMAIVTGVVPMPVTVTCENQRIRLFFGDNSGNWNSYSTAGKRVRPC